MTSPLPVRFFWQPGDVEIVSGPEKKFSPDEPRDEHGRWAEDGVTGITFPTQNIPSTATYDQTRAEQLTEDFISQGSDFSYATAESIENDRIGKDKAARAVAKRIPASAWQQPYAEYHARMLEMWGPQSRRTQNTPEAFDEYKRAQVQDFVNVWGGSAVRSPTSAAMQIDIQEMFNLPEDTSARARAYLANPRVDPSLLLRLKAEQPLRRTVLQAMYDETQAQLKAAGITELPLTRGLTFFPDIQDSSYPKPPDWFKKLEIGTPTSVSGAKHMPLSSWSLDHKIGERFADVGKDSGSVIEGALLRATIPASRIFSTGRSGLGTLSESEVVVIGGPGDVLVTRMKPWIPT